MHLKLTYTKHFAKQQVNEAEAKAEEDYVFRIRSISPAS